MSNGCKNKKQVSHGVLAGVCSTECLVKVTKPVHHSDHFLRCYSVVKDELWPCRALVKKGATSKSKRIQRILKRVLKYCATMAVLVGTSPENTASARSWLSWARYLADQLPGTFFLVAVQEGKIRIAKQWIHHLGGFRLSTRSELYLDEGQTDSREADSPASSKSKNPAGVSMDGNASLEGSPHYKEKGSWKSISVIRRELPELTLGWPLLRGTAPLVHEDSEALDASKFSGDRFGILVSENASVSDSSNHGDKKHRHRQRFSSSSFSAVANESALSRPGWPLLLVKTSATYDSSAESEEANISVVQRVMSLPNRTTDATPESQKDLVPEGVEGSVKQDILCEEDEHGKPGLVPPKNLHMKQHLISKLISSSCRPFSFEELKTATHQFSPENFMGEGGCSKVYRGSLACGKQVAVKLLKQYKEAWNDFTLEVDITSSLNHKHITPLIGVCIEDNSLVSVYDFSPEGSLEDILHGSDEKFVLPWKHRFKVAIAVAEALNYLHNECSPPVIHRDVKSSNILLSDEFQPQLSDFGLAIWGPSGSTDTIHNDIVGTFGYLAPEYVMQGRISDKIDVYSYGVVLLELISGKKPVSSLKGQESLVKWARPLLESGNLKALLDSKLDGDFKIVQIRRMIVAANLCIRQSAKLRPKASQILRLLKGKEGEREWMNSYVTDLKDSFSREDDDPFGEFDRLDISLLDLDSYSVSPSSVHATLLNGEGRQHNLTLKDLLNGEGRQHNLTLKDLLNGERRKHRFLNGEGRKHRLMLKDFLKESID